MRGLCAAPGSLQKGESKSEDSQHHGRHRMEEFFVQGSAQATQLISSRCCSDGWNTDSECGRKVRRGRCLTSNSQHRGESCSISLIAYHFLCLSSITLSPNSHAFLWNSPPAYSTSTFYCPSTPPLFSSLLPRPLSDMVDLRLLYLKAKKKLKKLVKRRWLRTYDYQVENLRSRPGFAAGPGRPTPFTPTAPPVAPPGTPGRGLATTYLMSPVGPAQVW
jgi:hypothetical protein